MTRQRLSRQDTTYMAGWPCASRRQRRNRFLRLEHLEPRIVLDGGGWDDYGRVSEQWFGLYRGVCGTRSEINLVAPSDSPDSDSPAYGIAPQAEVDRWLVRLVPESVSGATTFRDVEQLLRRTGTNYEVLRGLGLPGLVEVYVPGRTFQAVSADLGSNPLVASFTPDNLLLGPQGSPPNDASFGQQWGLENTGQTGGTADADIDALAAWDVTTGSTSTVVGIVDSGLDYTHEDLYQNVWINQGEIPVAMKSQVQPADSDGLITFRDLNDSRNAGLVTDANGNGYIDGYDLLHDSRWADGVDNEGNQFRDDLIGWDFQGNDNDPYDAHGHGTHVAGIIAAVGNNMRGVSGVNWAASLMALRYLDASNRGQTSDAIRALNYATLMRQDFGANVRVTNNSWGRSGDVNPELRSAIQAGADADILFVAAAGNGNILGRGVDNDVLPFYPASYDLPNIVSVAASDFNDQLATFSNYGRTSVDLAAPGVGILSTEPHSAAQPLGHYSWRNGTSMAAPFVTGVAALVASELPDATADEIRQALLQGVDVVPALKNRLATGGRLSAVGALLVDTYRPRVALQSAANIVEASGGVQEIRITIHDNVAVKLSRLDGYDLVVTPLAGTGEPIPAYLVHTDKTQDSPDVVAVYRIAAPGGNWDPADNGLYEISLLGGAVEDIHGNPAAAAVLGTFSVNVPNIGQILVDSLDDNPDANLADGLSDDGSGHSTLRAAIMQANHNLGLNTIVLPAGTFTLTLSGAGEDAAATGDLDITDQLTILGALEGGTIIDADGLDRVLDIHGDIQVELQHVTLRHGQTPTGEGGGAIRNAGRLTLSNSRVTGSQADRGGGIENTGRLTIITSTVDTNLAATTGGGLYHTGSQTASISNSTISSNQATIRGGGIDSSGPLQLASTTVAYNVTPGQAGGIAGSAANVARNTIIGANTATTSHPDVQGTFTSLGNNLVEDAGSATGFVDGVNGDLIGHSSARRDPQLGPLGDHGGLTPTHVLLANSPAVNAGTFTDAPATDQRGVRRPAAGEGYVDIGAYERRAVEIHGVQFHDANSNGVQDPGEAGLAGWTIYLDLNQNGQLDPGEPSTISAADNPATTGVDETGQYSFIDLEPGTYTVHELPQDNFTQTFPRDLMFTSSGTVNAGQGPSAVAGADLNRDEFVDLAIANRQDNSISLLFNQRDGSFEPAGAIPVGMGPIAVAAALVNSDSVPDLVVAHQGSPQLTVLLNQGYGTFVAGDPVNVAGAALALAAADLNGDTRTDLVVLVENSSSVQIWLNDGAGHFAAAPSIAVGSTVTALTAADLDGDGDQDLLVLHRGEASLRILVNNGQAGFTVSEPIFSGGSEPSAVVAAELSGDGRLDVAVANQGSNAVSVMLNQGDGTLGAAVSLAVGPAPLAVLASDWNSDGAVDLATLNAGNNTLSILLNQRDTSHDIPGQDTGSGQDYGDAPAPYPTLLADNGARHTLAVGGPTLGSSVGGDADGQPETRALGDDNDGQDDEDGVSHASLLWLRVGMNTSVNVDMTDSAANGVLNAWIDFNRDGDWADDGEQIFTDYAATAGQVHTLPLTVPTDATAGTTFARFRVSSVGGLSFVGAAPDGEVEDYYVRITDGNFYFNDDSTTNDVYTTAVGTNFNDGLTPATPSTRISEWINFYDLEPGDTFHVDTGVYNLSSDIEVRSADEGSSTAPVTFLGSPHPDGSVLDRGGGGAAFYLVHSDFVHIVGFRIRNASSGILTTGGGDGLLISGNQISNTTYAINANSTTNLTVTNNVLVDNQWGVTLSQSPPGSGNVIENNTFAVNVLGGVSFDNDTVSVTLRNNVFSQEGSGWCLYTVRDFFQTITDYNLFHVTGLANVGYYQVNRPTLADWQTATGRDPNSVSADPMFVDALAGDFRLQTGSPAIDAGDNTDVSATDHRGNPRILDGDVDHTATVDIGAFEFVPTVIAVSTTADKPDLNPGNGYVDTDTPGETTLRAAIMEANALAGPNIILLPAGTFGLSIAGAGEDLGITGDLDVTDPSGALTIIGAGSDATIIDAGGDTGILDRVFEVHTGGLHLQGLTVQGGRAGGGAATDALGSGGGLLVDAGAVSLTDVRVRGNRADYRGGGLFFNENSVDAATVINSTISNNYAEYYGGGVWTGRDTAITSSVIAGNAAGQLYGGGITHDSDADTLLQIVESSITGNTAHDGGGIATSSDLILRHSVISGNTVSGNGGGLRADMSTTTVAIEDSSFSDNQANQGGGLYNNATVTAIGTTFTGNQAIATADYTGGGAIYNGGISTAHLTLTNATISGNASANYGGGILNRGTAYVTNATITNNTSSQRAVNNLATAGTVFEIRNTIIAGNAGNRDIGDAGYTSRGHNLIGDIGNAVGFTHGLNGDLVGDSADGGPLNPQLGPLQDNGGPTQTHALLAGSLAIDGGGTAGVPASDQRGVPRALDGDGNGSHVPDIGAVEYLNPAWFFVDSFEDTVDANPGDGIVADANGRRTLRAAVQEANARAGNQTIVLAAGTYELSLPGVNEAAAATGDLDVTDTSGSLTIVGAGVDVTLIDASALDRVFEVAQDAVLNLENLTVTGGRGTGTNYGAGVRVFRGNLSIHNVKIDDNWAADRGGGIHSFRGTVTIDRSVISNNVGGGDGGNTIEDYGGGLYADGGQVTISQSTISGNTARVGAGLYLYDDTTLTMTASTVTGNSSTGSGGGVSAWNPTAVTITNSTISGNTAAGDGGGITFGGAVGTMTIVSSTITGNTASYGGGIASDRSPGLQNTVVAGNTAANANPDLKGSVTTLGNNLIGDVGTATGITNGSNGDIVGGGTNPVVNPQLGVLQDNGGPTWTHLPHWNSPLIDAGSSSGTPATDQRGAPRGGDGNGDGAAAVDIGAAEFGFFVETTVDYADAVPGDGMARDANGLTSLRAAIMEANASAGPDVILLRAGTYTLQLTGVDEDGAVTGDLDISDDVTILGVGAGSTTIDAQGIDRVFQVMAGKRLTLRGVTVSGGQSPANTDGGGILSSGILTIEDSVLSNNLTGNHGGGIWNDGGTVTIVRSTLSGNTSPGNAGAIGSTGATAQLTVTASAISGNSALYDGGAIYNVAGTATLTNSIVSGNAGTNSNGGAIWTGGNASLAVVATRFLDNQAGDGGGAIAVADGSVSVAQSSFSGGSALNGGGIFAAGGTTEITGSTFSANTASSHGGALFVQGTVSLTNVTMSGNSSNGAGAVANNGTLTIHSSTLVGNASLGGFAGAVFNASGTTTVKNSVLAASTAGAGDVAGSFTSLGHNLIGNPGSGTGFTNGVNGDQAGTSGSPLDPKLGPLQDNGGPTQTHRPLADSPLIDAGASNELTDQRGAPRSLDGDADGARVPDIGAVEYLDGFFVDSFEDTVDANPGDGVVADANGKRTLRAAIQEANAKAGADTIVLAAGSYTFAIPGIGEDAAATGDLDIQQDLTIIGTGSDSTTIDADDLDRVFQVWPNVAFHLSHVTITDGNPGGTDGGGGILNNGGTVTIADSVLSSHWSVGAGGGVYNVGGAVSVVNTDFANNRVAGYSGGAIANSWSGTLSIRNSTFNANSADDYGGAILTDSGVLSISDTVFSANIADWGGGAINAFGGTVSVVGSRFAGNRSGDRSAGAIGVSGDAVVAVSQSTFSGNLADDHGGAIYSSGSLTITGCTFAGNFAWYDGGAVFSSGGTVSISSSTFSGNKANDGAGAITNDGGRLEIVSSTIARNESGTAPAGLLNRTGTASVSHSIIAGSLYGYADVRGSFTTQGHNLIGNVGVATGFTHGVQGDLVGYAASPLDPLLAALADNGGPTLTHALLPGSPAIEAGNTSGVPAADQRGAPRVLDGNTDGIAISDIGAVEHFDPSWLFVDSFEDTADANPGDGVVADANGKRTLRAAIMEANAHAGADTIVLAAGQYELSLVGSGEDAAATGDLDITQNLTIIGSGADSVIIDANQIDRVFDILSGGSLQLTGMTLTGGLTDLGGGLRVRAGGSATVTDSLLTANHATTQGGAVSCESYAAAVSLVRTTLSANTAVTGAAIVVYGHATVQLADSTVIGNMTSQGSTILDNGTLIITRSTIANNEALFYAAINVGGTLTLTNSTISGNLAQDRIGAIAVQSGGTVTAMNSTITLNRALGSGFGAIKNEGAFQVQNSIIAGNLSPTSAVDIGGSRAFTSLGHNLIGSGVGGTGFTDGVNGDLVGTTGSLRDPLLGPLQDNGGPTYTHVPLPGSPAIDAGDDTDAPATDQTGIPRPQDGDGDGTATVDMGAVERYSGEIRGRVYLDLNQNGIQDADEPGLAGWTVFSDRNNNGQWDSGEPAAVTRADDAGTAAIDEGGRYAILSLAPSHYVVAAVLPAGWEQTAPGAPGFEHEVDLYAGQIVQDRDFGQSVTLAIDDPTLAAETHSGSTTLTFMVSLSAASTRPVTVQFATAAGTAIAGADYQSTSGSVTFDPGQTSKPVSVTVLGDLLDEFDETLSVVLSNASGARLAKAEGFGTILDDDALPRLSIDDVTVLAEGDLEDSFVEFTITLTPISGRDVWVDYATRQDSATVGSDFLATSGRLQFSAGETTKKILVQTLGDFEDEPAEDFFVDLSAAVYAEIQDGQGLGTIVDDDPLLTVNSLLDKADLTPGNGVVDTGTAGEITLRAAIMEANALPGPDWIILPAGTYTLTIGQAGENAGAKGDLDIIETTGSLTILGAGANVTVIDGNALDRVFQVLAGASLQLIGVTIQGGHATGVTSSTGGGLRNSGTLTLVDCRVLDNAAEGVGGGIDNSGSLSLTRTALSNNSASEGGGIHSLAGATLTIVDSMLQGNAAAQSGGAIIADGTIDITRSVLQANTAVLGGAIVNAGRLTITDSTLADNLATGLGGALFNGADFTAPVHVSGSTFVNNRATQQGGALYLGSEGSVSVVNSTFTQNSSARGGAVYNAYGALSLTNVTVAGNAASGAAGQGGGLSNAATTALRNTLVAQNTATLSAPDVAGTFTSLGYNLIGDSGSSSGFAHGVNGDQAGSSSQPILPLLLALQDNGGPTWTMALLPDSPAVDRGGSQEAPAVDQCGTPRPEDGDLNGSAVVDIGAFELTHNLPPQIDDQTWFADENVAEGTLIGVVQARGPEADDLVTMSLVSGNTGNAFALDPLNGQLTLVGSLNHENLDVYTLTVRGEDRGHRTTIATIVVRVNDLNESPFLVGSGISDRTRSDGVLTETLDLANVFGDHDAGDVLTLTAQSSNPALVGVQVLGGNLLEFTYLPYAANQDRTPAAVTVSGTDVGGLSVSDVFTVTVSPTRTFEYVLVAVAQPTPQNEVTTLPTSLSEVAQGQAYYAEIWLRDWFVPGLTALPANVTSDGVEQGAVDVTFLPGLSDAVRLEHTGIFDFSPGARGEIDQAGGRVNNFGGKTLIPARGVTPKYGRLGFVELVATGQGEQILGLELDAQLLATMRSSVAPADGTIHPSQIRLTEPIHVAVVPEGGSVPFAPAVHLATGTTATAFAVADVDSDGDRDLVVTDGVGNRVALLQNTPGFSHTVTLREGEVAAGVAFGVRPAAGQIGGRVYLDLNQNGLRDVVEPGLEDAIVYLDLDGDGQRDDGEPSRTTDATGDYVFTNLPTLTAYVVRQVLATGESLTEPSGNGTWTMALGPGQTAGGVNFGNVVEGGVSNSSISGIVFLDTNDNGLQDAGELGLPGEKVYLDVNDNGAWDADEPALTTRDDLPGTPSINEAGTYEFLSLGPGVFPVRMVQRSILRQTYPLDSGFTTHELVASDAPRSIAYGYLDADSKPDLAVANRDTNTVSVFSNPGAGGSAAFAKLTVGLGPASVVAGDWNGDTLVDLAVANNYSSDVSLLLNQGGGVFSSATSVAAGIGPRAIVAGDFNGDQALDLAIANDASNNVVVLLNDGHGQFTTRRAYLTDDSPVALIAADVNGDGHLDLAAANIDSNNVTLLVNDRTGNFAAVANLAVGTAPFALTSADFNCDGRADLAVGNILSDDITVLLNTGAGWSMALARFPTNQGPTSLAATDLDFDGDVDLVVTSGSSATLSVLRNRGDGTFADPTSFGQANFSDAAAFAVIAADLDRDGFADLAVANGMARTVSVLMNQPLPAAHDVVLTEDRIVTQVNFGFTPVSSPPTVEPATFQVPEGIAAGTLVGTVVATDPNPDDSLTFVITAGNTGGAFVIGHQTGVIRIASGQTLDFELQSTYSLTVQASDGRDEGEATITIQVTDVNEPATVSLTNSLATLPECLNNPTRRKVADIVVSDDALGDNSLSLSGADAGLFEIVSTVLYLKTGAALDGETNPVLDVTVAVDDPAVGGTPDDTAALAVTVTPTLLVSSFEATRSGFAVHLNHDLVPGVLNLYDQGGALGPADVTVVGATVGAVRGSLVVDPGLRKVTFIKTGGILAADTYTVTLISGTNAFRDPAGNLLDGNGDGTAGDAFQSNWTVTASPANSITVSLPDLARGYSQAVNLPANDPAAGIPLQLSEGLGVSRLELTLHYDPSLLEVQTFTLSTALQSRGGQAQFQVTSAGTATLQIIAPISFATASGPLVAGSFTAWVPATALYGGKHAIDIADLHVFNDAAEPVELPSVDDDAIHVAAFFGDTNGSRTYNNPDVTLVQRLIGQINTGFSAYQLADPLLLADITLNGKLQANDTVSIQRLIGQVPVVNVPALPAGITPPTASGADPKLSIPQTLSGSPGDTVTVPVKLLVTEPAGITLSGFDLVIQYDPVRFTLGGGQVGSLLSAYNFQGLLTQTVPGTVIYTASSAAGTGVLPWGTEGDLMTLSLAIVADAAGGAVPINLRASSGMTATAAFDLDLNELVLTPAPTDEALDAVDGQVTIVVSAVNQPPYLANPLTDQVAFPRSEFHYTVPAGTFADPDAGDTLTYSASLEAGLSLPPWLTFDPATNEFSGTPGMTDLGEIVVHMTVSDSGVPPLQASTTFRIVVGPWTNLADPLDVDANGHVAPLDVLLMINRVNAAGSGPLPAPVAGGPPPPYVDPDGDGSCTDRDVLLVINYLNAFVIAPAEGEAAAAAAAQVRREDKLWQSFEEDEDELWQLLADEVVARARREIWISFECDDWR
jgi:predicted outer membrane repeat protein